MFNINVIYDVSVLFVIMKIKYDYEKIVESINKYKSISKGFLFVGVNDQTFKMRLHQESKRLVKVLDFVPQNKRVVAELPSVFFDIKEALENESNMSKVCLKFQTDPSCFKSKLLSLWYKLNISYAIKGFSF